MLTILAQAAETAGSTLLSFDWDPALTTGGTTAAILGAVWVFFKVIRAIVGTLFMLCVTYLVLRVCFGIDLSAWILPLLGQ